MRDRVRPRSSPSCGHPCIGLHGPRVPRNAAAAEEVCRRTIRAHSRSRRRTVEQHRGRGCDHGGAARARHREAARAAAFARPAMDGTALVGPGDLADKLQLAGAQRAVAHVVEVRRAQRSSGACGCRADEMCSAPVCTLGKAAICRHTRTSTSRSSTGWTRRACGTARGRSGHRERRSMLSRRRREAGRQRVGLPLRCASSA